METRSGLVTQDVSDETESSHFELLSASSAYLMYIGSNVALFLLLEYLSPKKLLVPLIVAEVSADISIPVHATGPFP